jgi:hypothetical protein
VVVHLTNESLAVNGGHLVAFAFNNPSKLITSVTLISSSPSFQTLLGGDAFGNSVSSSPFGDFDLGNASTSSWLGGGSPTGEIVVVGSETFTFDLGGTGLNQLSVQSFIDTLSDNSDQTY